MADTKIERPIIFSTEMVKAILEERKTQTRRIVRKQHWLEPFGKCQSHRIKYFEGAWGCPCCGSSHLYNLQCPYGQVSGLIWVRETRWRNGGYVATNISNYPHEAKIPSIYMKKINARIWLEITRIKVEKLQDITLVDIKAEGLSIDRKFQETVDAWIDLWDSINAKLGYGWDKNPWVWVIEFQRVRPDPAG